MVIGIKEISSRPRVIETDEEILLVLAALDNSYREMIASVGPSGNIFGLFFHDLVIHFSGIIMQREFTRSYNESAEFPYVDQQYAKFPRLVETERYRLSSETNPLKHLLRQLQIIPMAIGNSVPYGYRQRRVLSKFINFLGGYKSETKAYLPKHTQQIDALSSVIEEICYEQNIPGVKLIRDNWVKYSQLHTTGVEKVLDGKTLILGNRQDLQNRKLAVNYLQQNRAVIAFCHGEIASSIFNEPMYDYAERALCTTLVEYGEKKNNVINSCTICPPERILNRNSNAIQSNFRPNETIRPVSVHSSRVLYIPTTYNRNHLYGPFHAYEDAVYAEWHNALLNVIPSLIFKAHPKSRGKTITALNSDNRQLEDCIREYDIIIIDYMATAGALAITTNKPIIYFDIGLRRLEGSFQSKLRERCQYVEIDINGDLRRQVNEGIATYEKRADPWSNVDIAGYSITKEESFQWRKLLLEVFHEAERH